MNQASFLGRITYEIELDNLNNEKQTPVIRNVLAVERKYSKEERKQRESERVQVADFIPFQVYGKKAELLKIYSHKGLRVLLTGKMSSYRSERNGIKKSGMSLIVDQIDFIDWRQQEQPNQLSESESKDVKEIDDMKRQEENRVNRREMNYNPTLDSQENQEKFISEEENEESQDDSIYDYTEDYYI